MHEQLRRFTGIMHKLHGWVGGVISTGDNRRQEGAKQGSAAEEAQLPADRQLSKTGSSESAISAQAEEGYNPIVSGLLALLIQQRALAALHADRLQQLGMLVWPPRGGKKMPA